MKHVDFLVYRVVNDITQLPEDTDMLVAPSSAEGVRIVLMKAMTSYIPVIAN